MPFLSVNRYLGLGKETTRGTAAVPAIWIPIDPNPDLTPNLTWLEDKGLRGSPVEQYDDVPSTRSDEYTFKGNVFLDTFPNLVMALLGSVDAVTGTVAPYTHVIGLDNAAATGSQPPSYTAVDVDNITESAGASKQITGGQLEELSVSFSADGALSYSSKLVGNPFTQTAPPSTQAFSTAVFVPAWSGTVTLAGAVSKVIVSGSIDVKRGTKPIFTVGQQGPYRLWAGPAVVTGKVVIIAEADDPTFVNALTRAHQTLSFLFTDPVSSDTVTFQMSDVQLKNPKVTSDKAWEEITADFVANANTTDAVDGGYSPIQIITTNSQSTAY